MEKERFMPQETAPPDDKTPAQNITFESSHSSGPGGQNVNKRETKVRARWNFENDPALTEDQKQRIRSAYPGRVTEAGELIVESQSERSRDANQRKAAARLLDLIARALEVAPERQETKVPFSAKRARLEEKHHTAAKKELRKKVDEW